MSPSAKGSVALRTEDAASVDVPSVRKGLNDYVRRLACTVDADWHDSYEETDEMLHEWLEACAGHIEGVLRVGVLRGAGFERCHEILKVVADTWSNIEAIPFRGDPGDSLGEGEAVELTPPYAGETIEVHSAEQLLGHAWPLLLARAAADEAVPDPPLLRMIKDAHDHGVQRPQEPSPEESIPDGLVNIVQRGRARLARLAARTDEWSTLPTTKKVHRMRRAIDRRFDGPLHRRTRDPAMFEGGGDEGCSVM